MVDNHIDMAATEVALPISSFPKITKHLPGPTTDVTYRLEEHR